MQHVDSVVTRFGDRSDRVEPHQVKHPSRLATTRRDNCQWSGFTTELKHRAYDAGLNKRRRRQIDDHAAASAYLG